MDDVCEEGLMTQDVLQRHHTYELIEAISIRNRFCGWEDDVKKTVL